MQAAYPWAGKLMLTLSNKSLLHAVIESRQLRGDEPHVVCRPYHAGTPINGYNILNSAWPCSLRGRGGACFLVLTLFRALWVARVRSKSCKKIKS
jgi:hypothetical protein